jgi:uncharacterized membrane protein YqaE (UPF0057 family)
VNLLDSGVSAAFREIFRLRFAPLKMTLLQKGLLETALMGYIPGLVHAVWIIARR